ncbi:MAG: HAMP domain-containing histidine kinase [Verrucomicrobia bacterium]|nr:HAMP domain-containing histidine kinase [Verrucomicrobiota bacterium]
MPNPRPKRKPTFHAQAILIVLPLVLLVAVGAWSLRQDRWLAEQEARGDARQFAERLLPEMSEVIAGPHSAALASAHAQAPASNTAFGAVLFQISQSGRLLIPAPVADPLPRPLDPAELNPALAEIRQTAHRAEFRDSAADTALTSYRLFLDHSPPDDFAAAARISVALLEAQRGGKPEALEQLRTVLTGNPLTLLESGLPAQPIAALKLVELAVDSDEPDIAWADLLGTVCSNAVQHPSWATQPLLQAVARFGEERELPDLKDWLSLWFQHEQARRLYFDARHQFQPARSISRAERMADPQNPGPARSLLGAAEPAGSSPFWISSQAVHWLVLPEPVASDRWIVTIPERVVAEKVEAVWRDAGNVPAYLGAGFNVASRQFRLAPDRLTGQWLPVVIPMRSASDLPRAQTSGPTADRAPIANGSIKLAAQSTTHPVLGVLELDIFLDNPSLLFARQRTRTYWFAALIALSASAALVGLVSAWRAFHRQQLLARMQGQFVSSVSHELRAPIASIRLLAEGLALIENVLDFSRIDQGRKQFEFEPTDIRALIRQTVRLMEPQATERQVTLTVDFLDADHGLQTSDHGTTDHGTTGVCLQASLDGRAIQQALVNLIDNAIKHAPPKSAVEVGLAFGPPAQAPSREPSSDQIDPATPFRLWVRDSGEGIPATEHEKIFEPFYRRGTELRRETTGIGIGLSIVRHIVAAHGGRVTVESEPGHGSKFTLHIP